MYITVVITIVATMPHVVTSTPSMRRERVRDRGYVRTFIQTSRVAIARSDISGYTTSEIEALDQGSIGCPWVLLGVTSPRVEQATCQNEIARGFGARMIVQR